MSAESDEDKAKALATQSIQQSIELLNSRTQLYAEQLENLDFNAPSDFFNSSRRVDDLEVKVFENALFVVFEYQRESLACVLILKSYNDDNCPLHFRLVLRGVWVRSPVEVGDMVRVIGKFSKQNEYTLLLDELEADTRSGEIEMQSNSNKQAKFLILEPKLMISTTAIVTSFPCVRKTVFQETFKNTN